MSHITLSLCALLQLASNGPAEPPHWLRAVHVPDSTLRATIEAVAKASPTFRTTLAAVAARGGAILLLTLDNVVDADEQFAREGIAQAAPVVMPDSSVTTVMVVLNLGVLRRTYTDAGVPADAYARDLERIVIHEVYGHAVPYLLAGNARGSCRDPQHETEPGCSVTRENEIRAEAGLGERAGYDLRGLELSEYLQ